MVLSFLLLFWVQPLFSLPKTADSIAQSYSNIKETGTNNAGFNDKEFERKMKDKPIYWKKSLQWCAFFLSLCLEESDAIFPTIRSGSSQKFITKQSIPFKDVLYGKKKLDKPCIIVYTNGNSITGHVDIVLKQISKTEFLVIGGNVGDKVTMRTIKYNANSAQRINCFTPIGY